MEDYSFTESIAKFFGSDKNDKLFLTGFNRGPSLAQTKDGIKAQFNMGTVSQRASDQIMYSIPALPGSSGSAVVNHKGQLVAINYAGVSTTQSFNYGIRVKYLKSLMKNRHPEWMTMMIFNKNFPYKGSFSMKSFLYRGIFENV